MPFTRAADGATLHYSVHDYTDPWRQAPTMILQHGFSRSGKFWFGMVPYLARFFRVVCPDTRGMGQSVPLDGARERLTVSHCVEDIATVAEALGVDRFHLVGESIAGGIGLMFAAQHPKRLGSLSVIAPAVYANDWIRKAYAVGHDSWEEAIRKLGVEGWVRESNTLARFPAEVGPDFLEWYAREVGKNSVESVAAMTHVAGSVDARPLLGQIEVPVLALYPTGGQIATADMKDALVSGVRDIRVVHIQTPYQMLNMLKPAECAQAILNFAAEQEGFVPRD